MFESAATAETRPASHDPWDADSGVQGTLSPNTERAMRSDWRIFTTWCAERGVDALPAHPKALAAFVDALGKQRAAATVRRYLASIAAVHRAEGLDTPRTEPVRQALRRMDRKKGRRQAQAQGTHLGVGAAHARRQEATRPSAARNRALLAVAYDTLLRRSELVSLRVDDLVREDDGSATVLVRRTKTDPEGHGALAWIAPDSVALLDKWLTGSRVRGPMFRALRNGVVGGPLGACEIPRIFKEMALEAGLPRGVVKDISGHSTRVGAAQDMVSKGIGLSLIMQTGRWKNEASVMRYAERMLARENGSGPACTPAAPDIINDERNHSTGGREAERQ